VQIRKLQNLHKKQKPVFFFILLIMMKAENQKAFQRRETQQKQGFIKYLSAYFIFN